MVILAFLAEHQGEIVESPDGEPVGQSVGNLQIEDVIGTPLSRSLSLVRSIARERLPEACRV